MKAEQAQEVARKAAADAEIASSTARQYSPTHSQPGDVSLIPSYCLSHRREGGYGIRRFLEEVMFSSA